MNASQEKRAGSGARSADPPRRSNRPPTWCWPKRRPMPETIHVPAMARVEGEGGLYIGVKDGSVREIRVDIYEPPRFFSGFLRGRFFEEVPDITALICGICPVA